MAHVARYSYSGAMTTSQNKRWYSYTTIALTMATPTSYPQQFIILETHCDSSDYTEKNDYCKTLIFQGK